MNRTFPAVVRDRIRDEIVQLLLDAKEGYTITQIQNKFIEEVRQYPRIVQSIIGSEKNYKGNIVGISIAGQRDKLFHKDRVDLLPLVQASASSASHERQLTPRIHKLLKSNPSIVLGIAWHENNWIITGAGITVRHKRLSDAVTRFSMVLSIKEE